ncbi:hypothetical protein HAX54_030548 [Datura stramonium]|uniref:Methyltransferase n=1 Tax=Datura stramonium TaxID=4076 RepID=A0ABS8V7V2_DATST|nr:hypothetical protein [Datura stramonium]
MKTKQNSLRGKPHDRPKQYRVDRGRAKDAPRQVFLDGDSRILVLVDPSVQLLDLDCFVFEDIARVVLKLEFSSAIKLWETLFPIGDLRDLDCDLDYLIGLCLGGDSIARVISFKENYVPCYNVSANILAGFKDGEELDRHCELSREHQHCLIRPPKDYKIPLSWPAGRDVIWSGNVKLTKHQFLSSGSIMKRLMLLEENQIAFHSQDGMIVDDVKDYSHQIAEMIGLGSDKEFLQAGVRTVLDIGCGFGSFSAHLLSLNLMALCVAAYGSSGSQVQLALERGLPAVIGNFISKQLPFPSLSYDMVHCAQCGIIWDSKDGLFLIEIDRVLKPGGYFVLTSPTTQQQDSSTSAKMGSVSTPLEEFTKKLCWSLLEQQEETFIWQKTVDSQCYTSGDRWVPIHSRSASMNSTELNVHGVHPDNFCEDSEFWKSAVINYWSFLSPLIFSDHPKRPGDDDPLPPYNMVRNVLDMNARYAGLNAALLEARKSVWVMNVVPLGMHNTLPLILDRGFAGVLHNWCEPFPTYPRTYDLLHGNGLLSHLASQGCSIVEVLFEMDRILRPEGWIILSDKLGPIEKVRMLATQMRWEARVINLQNGSDQRLLVCQKPFLRK